jgi:casein kinase II subunit alpha
MYLLSPKSTVVLLALYKLTLAELRTESRVYKHACTSKGPSYSDYEHFQFRDSDLLDPEAFTVTERLGSGKFSEVMEALDTQYRGHQRYVVLKVLKPTSPAKVKREVRILQILGGGMNVINLEGVCRDDDSGTTTLVLEHLGKGLQWLAHDIPQQQQQQQQHRSGRKKSTFKLSMLQIQLFMYKLLVALDYSHSCGVMHRDVKPRNVVIHKQSQQLRLIDWGLGDFYVPGKHLVQVYICLHQSGNA